MKGPPLRKKKQNHEDTNILKIILCHIKSRGKNKKDVGGINRPEEGSATIRDVKVRLLGGGGKGVKGEAPKGGRAH